MKEQLKLITNSASSFRGQVFHGKKGKKGDRQRSIACPLFQTKPVPPRTGTGFTLVELLIVVVIIGVLASLVIPRLAGQAERARTAEAYERLRLLRRAVIQYLDARGGGYDLSALPFNQRNIASYKDGEGPVGMAQGMWRRIGMEPLPANSFFTYNCGIGVCGFDDPTTSCCRASRAAHWINVRLDDGAYSCVGYRQDPNTGQCTYLCGGTTSLPCV